MKTIFASIVVLSSIFTVAPSLAVDASISPYCRADTIAYHENFCNAVANNESLGTENSKPKVEDTLLEE